MTESDDWLDRYARTHASMHHPSAYWVALPMIVVSVTGLLWNLPIPSEFSRISPLLNWGSTFLMVAAIYYFIISLSLAITLLPFLLGLAAVNMWLTTLSLPHGTVVSALLLAGIAALLIARKAALRAVTQDLQFIMLAPPWLLSVLYKRFGITY